MTKWVPTSATLLAQYIALNFNCVQGMFAAHCQTGDLYKDFVVKGEPGREQKLVAEAQHIFDLYAKRWLEEHKGEDAPILYWRYAAPHVFYYDDDEDGTNGAPRAALKMRLVLSNRPVRWADPKGAYDEFRRAELEAMLISPSGSA